MSVRIVKNCDRGLGNAALGRSRGQHFQARGHHSLSLYGPTLSRQITYLFFPVVNWLTSGFVYCLSNFVVELAYVSSTNYRKQSNERVTQIMILDKERCIKGRIHFDENRYTFETKFVRHVSVA